MIGTKRYPLICKAVAAIPAQSATIDGEAVWFDADGVAALEVRKDRLAKLIANAPAGLRYSEHMEGDGAVIFLHVCLLGCEGIVSKRRDHIYRSGPTKAWLKIKNPNAPGVLRLEERE